MSRQDIQRGLLFFRIFRSRVQQQMNSIYLLLEILGITLAEDQGHRSTNKPDNGHRARVPSRNRLGADRAIGSAGSQEGGVAVMRHEGCPRFVFIIQRLMKRSAFSVREAIHVKSVLGAGLCVNTRNPQKLQTTLGDN